MRKLLAVIGATLFMTACGGIEAEESAQDLGQTEQGLSTAATSCLPGYTQYSIWECEQVCSGNWGNILYTYCSNGTDEYVLRKSTPRCGACY